MLRIIADDKIPFLKGVLEPYAEISYLPCNKINREAIRDVDALLIRTRTICDPVLLQESKVTFIATATIGFDHIDTVYCESRNIHWANAPGCNSSSVQQYIASALIHLARFQKTELKGKTLGIIGVGNVGSKVADIARAYGMNVLLNDPPRARKEEENIFEEIDSLLAMSDIITLHVPLYSTGEDKTLHLFDEKMISKIKPSASLINTSRGEVIDTKALTTALTEGKISSAILDVWEDEPGIDLALMNKALLATPHIAGYSADGKANGTAMIVQALSRHFGLPLTEWFPTWIPKPVNPDIFIDGKGKSTEEILSETNSFTYDILADDQRLRSSPNTFEQQRGNYPIRREFPAFTVYKKNIDPPSSQTLKNLGFKVIDNTKD